jgi:hypothetical protein
LCGIEEHGPYGNEGGETNKKKGKCAFSDQFVFIFLNIEAEFEERGGCPTKALCKGFGLRPKRMLIRMGNVSLNINRLVIEIFNVLSV